MQLLCISYISEFLEIIIQEMHLEKERVILCGGWSHRFYGRQCEIMTKNVLLLYNLCNIITSPTRIKKKSLALVHIIVTNKQADESSSTAFNFGCSVNVARILNININRLKGKSLKVSKI